MKTKYRLIISDIDGTLTPIAMNAQPNEQVVQAVRQVVSNGVFFALASGRPFAMVKPVANRLGLVGPCIVDNGATIANAADGDVLWEAVLPSDDANRVLGFIRDFPLIRVSRESGANDRPTRVDATDKVRKISVHDVTPAQGEELISQVSQEMNEVVCVMAASYAGSHLIDIYFSNVNATKQHAVLKLTVILGVDRSETMGIGDGYNDFPLLMACGFKVAMGNAVDELKAIADYIAPSVDEDGVVDVIAKYCSK